MPVEITEYVGPSKPVRLEDSLRYACMSEGFSTRGVPPGLTKREAYCSVCTAPHCIYHPEMTPKMVMRRVGTRYPEKSMVWALFGKKGGVYREMRHSRE